jgi:hypothetical protein
LSSKNTEKIYIFSKKKAKKSPVRKSFAAWRAPPLRSPGGMKNFFRLLLGDRGRCGLAIKSFSIRKFGALAFVPVRDRPEISGHAGINFGLFSAFHFSVS